MSIYNHIDKKYGDGLGIQDWNNLSSAIAGSSGLGLAIDSAHKVGVGTATPSVKLDVAGEIKATSLTVSGGNLGFNSQTGQRINLWGTEHGIGVQGSTTYLRTSGNFAFYRGGVHAAGALDPGTNGTAPLVILTNNNVGIGTTSPSTRLEVAGEIKATKFTGDGSGLTNLSVGLTGLNLATTSGNVGIGTTSPTAKLHVNGQITATQFSGDGSRLTSLGLTGLNLATQSGNVGIGTVSPYYKLQVEGDVAIYGGSKEDTPGEGMHITNDCILFGGNNRGKETNSAQISAGKHIPDSLNIIGMGATAGARKINMWAEGGFHMRGGGDNVLGVFTDNQKLSFYLAKSTHGPERTISWDGDANWDLTSDARLKTNIEPEEQILPRLLQLPVKRYQWIDAGGQDPQKIGFLAQDVQPLFPELVGSHTNPETQEDTLTLKYANFGVLAIGGLRELKAQTDATIAEQSALIQRLEERIAALEQRLS